MVEKLRLFVAVEIPEEIRAGLYAFGQSNAADLVSTKWVPAANMHLTLKFLGYCPAEQVPQVIEQLKKATDRFRPFKFRLMTLGGFPSKKRARVFWAGTTGTLPEFVSLAGRCDKFLSEIGFERETREFHPHLTLARFKVPQDIRQVVEGMALPEIAAQSIEVNEIILFRSRLSPAGPTYEKIAVIPLAK